jgi:hypothetical protein
MHHSCKIAGLPPAYSIRPVLEPDLEIIDPVVFSVRFDLPVQARKSLCNWNTVWRVNVRAL